MFTHQGMDNIPRQVSSQQYSLQRFSLCHTLEKRDTQVHRGQRTNYSCITTITHRNKIRKQKKYVGKHPSLSLFWGGRRSSFLVKAWSWMSTTWHLAWFNRSCKISPSRTKPAISSLCPIQPLSTSLLLLLSWVGQSLGMGLVICFPLGECKKIKTVHMKVPIQAGLKQERRLHNHRTSTRKDNSKVKLWPGRGGGHL